MPSVRQNKLYNAELPHPNAKSLPQCLEMIERVRQLLRGSLEILEDLPLVVSRVRMYQHLRLAYEKVAILDGRNINVCDRPPGVANRVVDYHIVTSFSE